MVSVWSGLICTSPARAPAIVSSKLETNPSAKTTSAASMIGLRMGPRAPDQVKGSMSGPPSGNADARVQEDIADIRDQLRHQNDEDGDDRAGQKQLDIVVGGRLHQRPAEAVVVEQRLDDHHASQQP